MQHVLSKIQHARMRNPLNRINKALKTKEDMQAFVLVSFVLFILFVKCYMLVFNNQAKKTAGNNSNIEVKAGKTKNNI